MTVDPDAPIADGVCFSDLHGRSPGLQQALIAQGVVFTTAFRARGRLYNGHVIARDARAAQRRADLRGLGERVEAQLTLLADMAPPAPDGVRP